MTSKIWKKYVQKKNNQKQENYFFLALNFTRYTPPPKIPATADTILKTK
ncbi:MAG: hypothetical protein OEL77_02215 [Nitrosopumilus sp.]|nr:hypothetical protein [Nitrosopumilus sp.]